ncbi:tricalbin-1 isoform X2 [Apis mellifera carnica]|nr:tricalbin-1 isoform X2 [Apis mellifera carnica]
MILMENIILGPLELRELTLGEQTPYITRVRTVDYANDDDIDSQTDQMKLSIEADIQLDCEQFRMLITTRLFGKGVGMDIDLAVEKLSLSGTILATLTLNSNAPFPHATSLSVSFLEKPDVWFSVRILKTVQMMEMPLIKTWIHAVVTDALASWIVDPGHLEMNLRAHERPGPKFDSLTNSIPQGVLTVVLSQNGCSAPIGDEMRWLVVTLGDQRRVTATLNSTWNEDISFLVGALDNEKISIKLKAKRLVSTITLAQFELALGVYNWDNSQVIETVLQQKKPSRNSANIPNINARLEYTALPKLDPDLPQPELTEDNSHLSDVSSLLSTGSGLMEVTLIRAKDLVAKDLNGFSDPFCELKLNNETKYKSSIKKKTLNPCWDESSIMGLPRNGETLDIVLWDHDTFGMKDYLGKVSLTLDDIRKLSNNDQSHWFTLRGTKTGSVELKIKVLSEECETQSTYAASNISESSIQLNIENPETVSNIIRRPSMEKSKMRLHLDVVPPPPPPRTVTLLKPIISSQSDKTSIGSKDSNEMNGTQNSWIPRVITESVTDVKRGLKLRRFRSEVNIEEKNESKGITLSLEPRGGGEADATELLQGSGLAHAVSQPDMLGRIRQPSPRLKLRPNGL